MGKPKDDALKPLLTADGEPVFDEPWQAEALAIADTLVSKGMFDATTWSATLGEYLSAADAGNEPDNSLTYYNAVLAALEELIKNHSKIDSAAMENKRNDWETAYLATPHGKPVVLKM